MFLLAQGQHNAVTEPVSPAKGDGHPHSHLHTGRHVRGDFIIKGPVNGVDGGCHCDFCCLWHLPSTSSF